MKRKIVIFEEDVEDDLDLPPFPIFRPKSAVAMPPKKKRAKAAPKIIGYDHDCFTNHLPPKPLRRWIFDSKTRQKVSYDAAIKGSA